MYQALQEVGFDNYTMQLKEFMSNYDKEKEERREQRLAGGTTADAAAGQESKRHGVKRAANHVAEAADGGDQLFGDLEDL